MDTSPPLPGLALPEGRIEREFDRTPFPFHHDLHRLDCFGPEALLDLAGRYGGHPHDFFVASGAPEAGAAFYSVPRSSLTPSAAIAVMGEFPCRVLLKRPENHDGRFRALLDHLFEQVSRRRPDVTRAGLRRLESSVFISASATTTPFHFDPEVGFFCQIAGEKEYHVYAPTVLSEAELERFYKRGRIDIGQVALDGRDPEREHVFHLRPGDGFHQPQDAPHWVRTGASPSVSYTFVFETEATRARGHARAFNYYERRAGLSPAAPGARPVLDGAKARAVRLLDPLRQAVGRALRA